MKYWNNRIRISGSETWIGIDVVKKELFMQRDGRYTVLADFRSASAAEFVDEWIVTVAQKFPSTQRGWFR